MKPRRTVLTLVTPAFIPFLLFLHALSRRFLSLFFSLSFHFISFLLSFFPLPLLPCALLVSPSRWPPCRKNASRRPILSFGTWWHQLILILSNKEDYVGIIRIKEATMDAAVSCMPLRSSLCPIASASLFTGPLILKKTKRLPYLSVILDNAEGSALEKSPSEFVTRRLILLRHAESSWNDHSLRDHDRPLSKVGRADAADVSYKLQLLDWVPEVVLCSDATRTRETLSVMQEVVKGFLQAAVHYIPSFYSVAAMDGQTAEHLQQMVCKFSSDDILTVMCMGHNKGWEEAASVLTGSVIELKTCNAALLEATGKSWEEAFELAGLGGWKLQGLVKPNSSLENYVPT